MIVIIIIVIIEHKMVHKNADSCIYDKSVHSHESNAS